MDDFFAVKDGDQSHAADIEPEEQLPENLGGLTPEEQLLVLYFRQLHDHDKTQFMAEVSIISARTREELYGPDEEDIVLTEEEYQKRKNKKS